MSEFQIASQRIKEWEYQNDPQEILDLSHLGLYILPQLPDNLVILNCQGNNLTQLPEFLKIEELNCESNKLQHIPMLINCKILHCSYQKTTELRFQDNIPQLRELYCNNSNVRVLPMCDGLIQLGCSDNNISIIPMYPNLKILSCGTNQITSIDNITTLTNLSCYHNQLTQIPHANYTTLNCSKNILISLPDLPEVEELICDHNKLKSLPSCPNAQHINCSYNQITNLQNIEKVTVFNCSYNKITKLPALNYVIELECKNNLLSSLPELPHAKFVDAGDNKLTKLNKMPNIEQLNISYNRVRKIPYGLNNIVELYAIDNPIITIPSYLREIKSLETLQLTLENISDQTQYLNWDVISTDKYQADYEDLDSDYYEFSRATRKIQHTRAQRASDSTNSLSSFNSVSDNQIEFQDNDIIGDICRTNRHVTNRTTIIYYNNLSECYHDNQLLSTWNQQPHCYIKSTQEKIYRLPYRDAWIDYPAYWLLQSYNAVMLKQVKMITTSYDEQVMLFTCVPIHINEWKQGHNEFSTTKPWYPEPEDYNHNFININSQEYIQHPTHHTDGKNTILFTDKNQRLTWSQEKTILFQGSTQAIYHGDLDDVQRNGFGTMTWYHQNKPDMTYVGEWQDDNMEGLGTYHGLWLHGAISTL